MRLLSRIDACLWGICAVSVVAAAVWLVKFHLQPIREHRERYDHIRAAIERLPARRPPDISRDEWSFVLGYTHNGLGNACGSQYVIADQSAFEQFASEIDSHVDGPVEMATIDWIWDQFERMSPTAKRYTQKWRPTTPERLSESSHVHWGIEVQ